MIEQLFLEYLKLKKSVYIDGLGTFEIKYIPAYIQPVVDILYPPKEIIKYTPEKVTENFFHTYISQKIGCDEQTAKIYIENWIKPVLTLNKGDEISIKGLGLFKKNLLNELEYEEIYPYSEYYNLPEIDLKNFLSHLNIKRENKKTILEQPNNYSDKNKNKSIKFAIIVSIIFLIFIVVFIVFYPKMINTYEYLTTTKDSIRNDQIEEKIVIKQEKDSLRDKTINSEQQKNITHKYYIIAGSFASSENANNFTESLKNQGLNAFLYGKQRGMYLVCCGVFYNLQEAKNFIISEKKRLKEAWILEKIE